MPAASGKTLRPGSSRSREWRSCWSRWQRPGLWRHRGIRWRALVAYVGAAVDSDVPHPSDGSPDAIDWHLRPRNGQYRITDLVIGSTARGTAASDCAGALAADLDQ